MSKLVEMQLTYERAPSFSNNSPPLNKCGLHHFHRCINPFIVYDVKCKCVPTCRTKLDVSRDLTVEVGQTTFMLHKFLIIGKSGKIRKMLIETPESTISLPSVPGGADGFELALNFCYGVRVEISPFNVGIISCVARFLEMTEDVAQLNMEALAESFLHRIVLNSIKDSISVLHRCECLLPLAEEINLVGRLVNAIAAIARHEQHIVGHSETEWWGRSLVVLSVDFFHKVLSEMKSNGLSSDVISNILIHYAHQSLPPARDSQMMASYHLNTGYHAKHRAIVETVVGLLPSPSRNSGVHVSFLSTLLKIALASSASPYCTSDLERRIAMQLDDAILEDVLISTNAENTSYDTESIARIFLFYLNLDEVEGEHSKSSSYLDDLEMGSNWESPYSTTQKVSKLMDSYLAEIAVDPTLMSDRFTTLVELLPDHARLVSDNLYRAVDIFLKVHPNVKEAERHRLGKAIDCKKLSREACSHAAQNERLPVQMAVQVLYLEQMRLRNVMNEGGNQLGFGSMTTSLTNRSGSRGASGGMSPRDNYASVRRENRELKQEVARMRMRLTDLEKDHVSMKEELVKAQASSGLFKSFAKKLSQLNTLFHINSVRPGPGSKTNSEIRSLFPRRRRHSVS